MEYKEPTTFEEWVEIHGEPDYITPPQPRSPQDLLITIEDCTPEEEDAPDPTGCVTIDKNGNPTINYGRFVDVFAEINQLVYCNGIFYTPHGSVSTSSIRRDIAQTLQDFGWTSKLDTPTNSLFQTLKDKYSVDTIPVDANIIPLANGDLHISTTPWEFHLGELKQTPYRLATAYTPQDKPAPLFRKWLDDIFTPEDQRTLQQLIGYLLLPTTRCQEAFFLVGEGGVGKSVLGVILEAIFGNSYTSITTGDLVGKQFQLSQAENKLVLYDDDLGTAALTETSTLKKLITADQALPAERKYADPYNFRSYARIVACANFMLSSLYDDSDGFWRRLHPIQVLPKDPARQVIRNFGQKIAQAEAPQILRWALRGLRDVIASGWNIYWSDRSKEYLGQIRTEQNYILAFFQDCFELGETYDTSAKEVLDVYKRWADANGFKQVSPDKLQKNFNKFINANTAIITEKSDSERTGSSDLYLYTPVHRGNNLYRDGRRVRGYTGFRVKKEWLLTFSIK